MPRSRKIIRLQESLEDNRSLVDTVDGIVWEANEKFQFTFVSKQAERLFGYPVERWIKDPTFWVDHLHHEDRERAINFCKERLIQKVAHEFEYRMIAADGRVVWLRDIVSVVVENDRLLKLRGIMVDITAQKQVEDELQKARGELENRVQERTEELSRLNLFLNSLIENIPNMISVKDAKTLRFVRFNRAGEDLLGYRREELIGKNDYDLFPKADADFFTSKDHLVLNAGTALDIPEETIHTRSHGLRILHTKKIPILGKNERPEYLLGISEDITEVKKAEEGRVRLIHEREARIEAEKSLQLRDDFLSIASHELRTPLTPIRMNLQLLKRHMRSFVPNAPKAALFLKALESADQQVDHFIKLVESLLDVSRVTAGRLVLTREEFDLSELVQQILDRFEPEIKEVGLQLAVKLEPQVRGLWDRLRIEQVIISLLTNAMKYGAGKPIEIMLFTERSRSGEPRVILKVSDHGIGISKEDQSRVFERFERLASVKHFAGLGLGLYLTRSIVSAHGGTISLESEPGVGSTFTVELPLALERFGTPYASAA